jgi:serine/threonine-protein kinase
VVHRDFKPHNVIVDAEGCAKVTDFGIARAGASDMTETGSIMGTAQYLSPEQAQGRPVSAQSDLYSIGIVLYELLTGRVPFDGDSPVTIALKQVSEAPVPPSALNPDVPPALEAVVLRALEKEPSARYQDAESFADALHAALDAPAGPPPRRRATGAHTVAAAPVAPPPLVEDPVVAELVEDDRRTLRILGVAALVLLLAAAVGYAAYTQLRAETVAVPDVVRNSSATAIARLQNAGFAVDPQRARNANVREDRVFRQDPSPGERAEKGSTVTILVSDGPGDGTIPGVEGETERDARRRVQAAGFKVRVTRDTSDEVAEGRVIETSPPSRSRLQKGRTVELLISSGPEQVEVPEVVGRPRDEAKSALEAAGFRVTEKGRESGDEEPGTVLATSPKAGATVDAGSTVELTVAKAPKLVAVPDVTGEEEAAARRALEAAGLKPRVREEEVSDAAEDGRVVDQNPPPDSERRRGATVYIDVGKLVEPDEPPEDTATPEPTPTPTPSPTP